MPACTGLPEYAVALQTHMCSDGVHFTDSGYKCLSSHINSIPDNKTKNFSAAPLNISGTRRAGKQSFYWRGFVSPVGTGRPTNHKAAYLQSHSKPAAGRGTAGGKWRNPSESIHHRTLYGGDKRKNRVKGWDRNITVGVRLYFPFLFSVLSFFNFLSLFLTQVCHISSSELNRILKLVIYRGEYVCFV